MVLARPILSPRIPKKIPPSAQPIMKIGRGVSAVFVDLARPSRDHRVRPDQLGDGRLARQVEELLVHRVEEPAQRGDGEHEPLVRRDVPPPGSSGEIGGWLASGTAVERHRGRSPEGENSGRPTIRPCREPAGNRPAGFAGKTHSHHGVAAAKIVAMRRKIWLILLAQTAWSSCSSTAIASKRMPLGIPGEWEWLRVHARPSLVGLFLSGLAVAFYCGFVALGLRAVASPRLALPREAGLAGRAAGGVDRDPGLDPGRSRR